MFEGNCSYSCSDIPTFLIQLYLEFIVWANVLSVFRMAPPTRQIPGREDVPPPPPAPENPPPPPPPPTKAWKVVMAATNANTQMLIQLLQERTNQQQGNFNHGGNQFANLSQFLSNQPKTFTSCDQPFDAKDWIHDMNKHFECNNVRPKDFVKFATSS